MTATEKWFSTSAGEFRALTWGSGPETVVLLHGLTAMAEVWGPALAHLPGDRRYVALDQRGHGGSPKPLTGYGTAAYVRDAIEVIEQLGAPVHMAGHSMGARITMLLAARHPQILRSAAIVDIGPEALQANIRATVGALSTRPERFATREAALAFAFRRREPGTNEATLFLSRLEGVGGEALGWRAPRRALEETVRLHRQRNYWNEWRKIVLPALFIHGGRSTEVSMRISEKMRAENPGVLFERYDNVGHNIPLLAPERLAHSLERFWKGITALSDGGPAA